MQNSCSLISAFYQGMVIISCLFLLTACPDKPRLAITFDMSVTEDQMKVDPKADMETAVVPKACEQDIDCDSQQYCKIIDDMGQCTTGCRLPTSDNPTPCLYRGADYQCDENTRECIFVCEQDLDCAPQEYCSDEGKCKEGCRLDDQACTPTSTNPRVCDPNTRQCIEQSVCCLPNQSCTIGSESACEEMNGEVMLGVNACTPSPCGSSCFRDDQCAPSEYCANYGRCTVGCRVNEINACPTSLNCNAQTRICEPAPCTEDANCLESQYCANGQCQTGCRINGCPQGLSCNDDHACVPRCVQDQDCQGDEYCDLNLNRCRTQCDPLTHQPCDQTERCDVNRCVFGCADDPFELLGDQVQNTAPIYTFPFPDAVRKLGDAQNRRLCVNDIDWIQVPIQAGERIEIVVEYATSLARLALSLHSPTGEEIAQNAIWANRQTLVYPSLNQSIPTSGHYGIKISALQQVSAVPYKLTINIVGGIAPAYGCFNDLNDPSDNSVSTAQSIGLTPALNFSERYQGNLCLGDRDWYCFPMNLSDGVDVYLNTPAHCETGVRAYLSPANIATQIERTGDVSLSTYQLSNVEGDLHRLQFLGDADSGSFSNDRWCLGIENDNRSGNRNQCEGYQIELGFQRRQAVCTDLREPNNTIFNPTILDEQGPLANDQGRLPYAVDLALQENLILCQGEQDIFQVTPLIGDALIAWIVDASDVNNNQSTLVGSLELSFMDAQGNRIGDSALINPKDRLQPITATAIAGSSEPMYLKVSGIGDSSGAYQLFIRRNANNGECSQDINESQLARDDQLSPTSTLREVGENHFSIANGYLCDPNDRGDEDWYSFNVSEENTRVCISSRFRYQQGNIDLDLFRVENNNGLACQNHETCRMNQANSSCVNRRCLAPTTTSNRIGDGEMIHYAGLQSRSGNHFLRVYSPNVETQNAYQLDISLIPPIAVGANCPADEYEGNSNNNEQRTAFDLGSGQVAICDAWVCERERNEGDWYGITIPAMSQRTIHISYESQQGRLLLNAQNALSLDGVVVESPRSPNRNVHCINVSAGNTPGFVSFQIAGDIFNLNQAKIDYVLQVVPTDLSIEARGQCDALNGGLFSDVAWPTLRL